MGSSTTLWFGVLFGALGAGYLIYGRKQRRGMALLSGIVLIALPYIASNLWLTVLVGAVFLALPFFVTH